MRTTTIEEKVMASVLLIYVGRRLLSPAGLSLVILGLSALALISLVSVSSVAANLSAVGLLGLGHFVAVALAETRFLVQIALLAGGVALISWLFSVVRGAAPVGVRA